MLARSFLLVLVLGVACGPTSKSSLVTSDVVLTARVPARVVAGVVLDGITLNPISKAQVYFIPDSRVRSFGDITDDSGVFRLAGLPFGTGTLNVESLGYATEQVSLTIDSDDGYGARIALKWVGICLCTHLVTTPNAVTVRVRDAVTGGRPSGEVTLMVRDGAYGDTTVADPSSLPDTAALVIGAAPGRSGIYDVSVIGRRYHPWKVAGIVVERSCCNDF